ncbi:MAG: YbhB/YbcL family Raf kinase inhibitor-like protein [bacterium]
MKLTSSAFSDGERIPAKHTCDGENVSPSLSILDVPEGTESLALVMDDPDATIGTFDHWVVWNIPADVQRISEGTEPPGVQGMTDFGRVGYGGPCPPSCVHGYRFKLYALSKKLDLKEGSNKEELERAMEGNIIEETLLVGKYGR